MDSFVIRGARWVESGMAGIAADVVVRSGMITAVGPNTGAAQPGRVIDGSGCILAPGFLDLHCHLRVPGQEDKETVQSGTRAAAAGGFTRIVAMANTDPPVDNIGTLGELTRQTAAAPVRVLPAAAVTVGLAGKELTDMGLLASFGAVAFTDDGRHAYGGDLATAAMRRAAAAGRVLMIHAQDEASCRHGQVSPTVAARAGLVPWPCSAEADAVEDMLRALRKGGGRLHVQHVSCAATLDHLRAARAEGLAVTAEATPHHLVLTEARVMANGSDADPEAKVNPPLRSEADRSALVHALAEGLIDAIATDHAPHQAETKAVSFAEASFGFSGLETALPLCLSLVEMGGLSMERLVHLLTAGPRRCLGGPVATMPARLRVGDPADLVLFDPADSWVVDSAAFASRGHNTPLQGRTLKGRVRLTVAGGRVVHDLEGAPIA
ncbi:MAG: dihydroorotase [Candidatus Dormibacteria bacterium]